MAKTATIFALATAPGVGGVAVVRVSGPGAGETLRAMSGAELPPPRRAMLAAIVDPASRVSLDRGMCLWFPAPRSFTGEDVAEFHLHGGRATVAAVVAALGRRPDHRMAEPGEFSRRAFLNGKMDLTEAEGLADLVAAETEAQRRQALRQLGGALGRLYEGWRARLVGGLARLEAAIDFSDEDLPEGLAENVLVEIGLIGDEVCAHLDDGGRGERLRDGFHIAIVGSPNVGKSSLLNLLARRDAAIVAETAGTTRDVVECHLNIGGLPVLVADTAGIRRSDEPVEREGVLRALARAGSADLVLILVDARDTAVPAELADLPRSVLVGNKIDLLHRRNESSVRESPAFGISAHTGEGLEALLGEIVRLLSENFAMTESPSLTRARHRAALEICHDHLERCDRGMEIALVAENLRLAVRGLGRITGRVGVEEILDVVFSEFCIGK